MMIYNITGLIISGRILQDSMENMEYTMHHLKDKTSV